MVGNRLKHPRSRYRRMIDPPEGGRRCWTIKYAEGTKFHLDVLPAIPASFSKLGEHVSPIVRSDTAILITDRETWSDPLALWPHSDPKGYATWFRSRMAPTLESAKRAYAYAVKAEVERVRDFDVRTPLQQAVQILKRHRDVRYNGDNDKPISIIITTLAASAYENETNLADALLSVVPRMRKLIARRGEDWWVPNPVDPEENFADKWRESPRKASCFFDWVESLEREIMALLTSKGMANIATYLRDAFGEREARSALNLCTKRHPSILKGAQVAPIVLVPAKPGPARPTRTVALSKPAKPWSEECACG